MENEARGPAETILQTLLTHSDHMVHNRPGMVVNDAHASVGVRWIPVTHKEENNQKVVYKLEKIGRKTRRTKVGVLHENGKIQNGRVVGEYLTPGLFPRIAEWIYRQIAEVWKLDNEFAAHWASYAYRQEHRDLKTALAAFMLVQARKGDPVREDGAVAFYDEDYRDVGEAMILLYEKGHDLNPKLLLRVHDLLSLPEIAAINRELGFGKSARKPFLGRWPRAVEKWLRFREENKKLLEGLVKAGFRTTVIKLAQRIRYKPSTPWFFEVLRWKQSQATEGHRSIMIGQEVAAAETWEALDEMAICEKIESERPSFKRIVGLLPQRIGLTRAVVAAAIEAGSLSDKDLIILTPTMEELGLLEISAIQDRWQAAVKAAEDMRAANIAARVKSKKTRDQLQEAADNAVKAAVEEVIKDIRVYFMVDISGSMTDSIPRAKNYIAKFLQGFPVDRVHVAVFNTSGREVKIKHPSAAGVENAFRGLSAGGGTDYGSGVRVLSIHRPKDDEDVLFIFVGDEEQSRHFAGAVRKSNLNPMAFGFVKVAGGRWSHGNGTAVRETAAELGVPCFMMEEATFDDPYAIPRTVRNLVAATPVKQRGAVGAARVSLVDTILKTGLLQKPAWAS